MFCQYCGNLSFLFYFAYGEIILAFFTLNILYTSITECTILSNFFQISNPKLKK